MAHAGDCGAGAAVDDLSAIVEVQVDLWLQRQKSKGVVIRDDARRGQT